MFAFSSLLVYSVYLLGGDFSGLYNEKEAFGSYSCQKFLARKAHLLQTFIEKDPMIWKKMNLMIPFQKFTS